MDEPRARSSPVLLSIDLAAVTGWAIGGLSATVPICGVWELPRADRVDRCAARIAALENTLIRALDTWRPDLVVHAEPFISRNIAECRQSFGLLGQLSAECWRREIRVLQQPETTVRKEVLGRGRADTDQMKALVLAWCAQRGIDAADHNAGDAAVLWCWTRDELVRQMKSARGGIAPCR